VVVVREQILVVHKVQMEKLILVEEVEELTEVLEQG
jgi:hypothetical protein